MVGKDELMRTVWPDASVEENNLTQNISALRKILGEEPDEHRYIVTVPGHGYRFVAPVTELAHERADVVMTTHTLTRSVMEDELIVTPKRLVVGLAGVLIIALSAWGLWRLAMPPARIDSIAVLPFENDTRNPNFNYISEGLTDTITNSLSQLGVLRVIPRSSTIHLRGSRDPLQVGRTLHVRAVLTGHIVNAEDGTLAVQAELTDTEKQSQLWGRRFQVRPADILSVEGRVASEVTDRLLGGIVRAEHRQVRGSTTNSEAFVVYLRARYAAESRTPASLHQAVGLYKSALEKDPNYAAAYRGLYAAYMLQSEYAGVPLEEVRTDAEAALKRALQLDPSSAEAHVYRAQFDILELKWDEARKELDRALQLDPKFVRAYHFRGIWLYAHERYDEARPVFEHGIQLDPLSSVLHANLAFIAHAAGDFREAERAAARLLQFDPDFSLAHQFLGEAFAREGKSDAAIEELQKAVELSQRSPTALARLGFTYGFLGQREKALEIARELEQKHEQHRAPGMFVAVVYAGLHDNDRVFRWLTRDPPNSNAVTYQSPGWWELQSVHNDPRWRDFLRKLRLAG